MCPKSQTDFIKAMFTLQGKVVRLYFLIRLQNRP